MKKWAICLLCLLLMCGCTPQPRQPLDEFQLNPEEYSLLRQDVSTLLLVGMNDNWPDTNRIHSLTLLAADLETAEIFCIQLPLNTRVLVDLLDPETGKVTGRAYAPITDAYAQGLAFGDLALNNLARSVSHLFGGIPVDHWLAYSKSGLMRAVNAMGGVEVKMSSQLMGSGLSTSGTETLAGEDAWTYMSYQINENAGTQQKQLRQLAVMHSLVQSLCDTSPADSLSDILDRADIQIRYNLDGEWFSSLSQLSSDNAFAETQVQSWLLWGENRKLNDQEFWLPGEASVKEWTLDVFYHFSY